MFKWFIYPIQDGEAIHQSAALSKPSMNSSSNMHRSAALSKPLMNSGSTSDLSSLQSVEYREFREPAKIDLERRKNNTGAPNNFSRGGGVGKTNFYLLKPIVYRGMMELLDFQLLRTPFTFHSYHGKKVPNVTKFGDMKGFSFTNLNIFFNI